MNGEAGRVGLSPSDTDFIYGMGASVRIPVFDRGRQQARLATATADLQRRRALLADMRGSIDFDVRSAFLDVHAAEQALEAARVGRELATQQLAQSRDRFSAGVAGSLEVVQSQEARRGRKRQLHICALRAQHRQGDPRTCRRCGGGRNQGVSRRRTLMADTESLRERAARAASTRLKLIIPVALVLLAVVALTWWYYGGRESTDDAQVDGHITQISASGGRAGWSVST